MLRCLLLGSSLLLSACSITPSEPNHSALAEIDMQLGLQDLNQHQPLAAKAELLQALTLAPQNAEIHAAWGYYLENTGAIAAASAAYAQALNLAPQNPQLVDEYAVFLYRQGQYQTALHYFLKAAGHPTYLYTAVAYQNASLAAAKLGDQIAARKYRQQALQGLPDLTTGS